jgi:predicted DNA-binding transcriptional regulator AlpA
MLLLLPHERTDQNVDRAASLELVPVARDSEMTRSRLLPAKQAASYLSISVGAFHAWIAVGRLPRPLPGTRRWDRHAIDRAIDKLSGLTPPPVPSDDQFAEWERTYESAKGARGR